LGDEFEVHRKRNQMINKTISHYKIIEKLGEGGMGVVYKAQDTKLKRMVALKFLPQELLCDSESKARFIHEAQAASALNHPNITTIHEIDEVEGECFISMEYIEGKSIKELIKEKSLSIQEVLNISVQIAEGMNTAHKKGIVHRDIKSDNITVTPEALVKIMDFGLAKLKGATTITKTGSTLGTVAYMSPEQAQGIEVDQRSDIFSFGVVLYEMITGQLPFKGEHEAAIIYSIMNETPEPLARYKANVPEGLQRIVDKATAKDKEERYQHADELLADLRREKKSFEYVKVPKIPGEAQIPKKRLTPFIIPASIVFVVILVFLILKPFKFEIGPERRAIAEENSLAIMYFENMADREDSDKIAQMITALLITGLSESQYMRVVSRQRLYDILELLGKQDLKVIDKTVASKIAQKAGVKWILTGSILQTEPNIVLTSDISEARTGKILTTQRINGEAGEDLFTVVDKLATEVKEDLSLPEGAKRELDRSVAEVTTHSPEAYRYYLEGLDYMQKIYNVEAERSFRKALEIDSTFAMAYYQLSFIGSEDWEVMLAKTEEYSDKVSHKEKCYIKALKAFFSGNETEGIKELNKLVERYPEEKKAFYDLGSYYYGVRQFEEAVRNLNKAIEIDPLYKLAYNQLAYVYNEMGDFEKSIWAINKYISLAPDEPNPYDTRGDLYVSNGKIDKAIESYKKALEIKPDFQLETVEKLGNMYLFKMEYAKAESCYQKITSSSDKDYRAWGRTHLAYVPLYQGKFEKTLEVLDNGIAADKMEQTEYNEWTKRLLKSIIYWEKKNLNLAFEEDEKSREIWRSLYPDDKISGGGTYVHLLAANGNFEKAEEAAKTLKKDIEENDQTQMHSYWYALGAIEFAKGNFQAAAKHFEKLAEEEGWVKGSYFQERTMLGRTYLESGRLDEAVSEFEELLSSYSSGRLYWAIWSVKAYYYLGLAYEKSGWNKRAIEKYEEFLDIWKDADPGIPEVEDAKERLKKLKIES
jgi:tetratricopeptide (TPR) repeat protein/tRNA A-37 threonylcarbamoyl transferase component Bud32